MDFIILDPNSKTPLADAIKKVVFNERRNYNILIVGKTQMRKSTTAVKLATEISDRFDVRKHCAVIFADDFMRILTEEKLKRGDVVIADDFGVGLNHRKWYSSLNEALNLTLQTHGYRGLVVIVTTPYEKYIDSDVRLLFDMIITIMKKSDQQRWALAKVECLDHVKIGDKIRTYCKYPRVAMPNGKVVRVERIRIRYPPEEILREYFKHANEAKMRLQKVLAANVLESSKDQKKGGVDIKPLVAEVLKDPDRFIAYYGERKLIDVFTVMNEFNVSEKLARRIKAAAEKELGIGFMKRGG